MNTPLPQQELRQHDPFWVDLLERHGFSLSRDTDAWVSYDGRGTIAVAPDELLDADDCLAQIVFHELCHFWVEGPDSRALPDWGLENTNDEHLWREHAALLLQAQLTDRFGLRSVLVATTDFRPWYEALRPDPAAGVDPAIVALAASGMQIALTSPLWPACEELLQAAAALTGSVAAPSSEDP